MLSIIINLHWDFSALSVPLVPRGKREAWIFRRLEVQFPMGMPVLKVCVSIFFACSHLDTSPKWQIQRISVVNYKQSCRKMTTQCLIAACHGWTVPTPMWFNPCVYYSVASLDYCTVRWVNAAHTVQKKAHLACFWQECWFCTENAHYFQNPAACLCGWTNY